MADEDPRSPSKGWGHQVGQALAVLIPALLTGVAGYYARGNTPPETNQITPVEISKTEESTAEILLRKQLVESQNRVRELETKIETLPSTLVTSISTYRTPASTTDVTTCSTQLEGSLNVNSVEFTKYGALYQIDNAKSGLYILCEASGDITYYVVTEGSASDKMSYIRSLVMKAFE